ncbi:MAG: hypothetical protein RLZZ262_1254 [Bacteroidota bacterium]|jgi:3-methyladenine DNA glycosylase AlkC
MMKLVRLEFFRFALQLVDSNSFMEPLKNMYSPDLLKSIGEQIKKEYSSFDHKNWMKHFVTSEWKVAELKQRVNLIALAFYDTLPKDYNQAIDILKPVSNQMSYGYAGVIFSEFVMLYGRQHWDKSMEAMAVFTQTSTAEFAIRQFILDDPKKAMRQMVQWSKSDNHHIRRLSSEGCRPRLPWGVKLSMFVNDPTPCLEILNRLKSDPELYVRKSVANHLNDISKDNPMIALQLAKEWYGKNANSDWVVKHGLRGLLKAGNVEALKILGQSASKHLSVTQHRVHQKKVLLGDRISFTVEIVNASKHEEQLRLEYAIDYMKSNGQTSRKVFQWINKMVEPGAHRFEKNQILKDITTRKHYEGKHGWAVVVNGEEKGSASFELHFE